MSKDWRIDRDNFPEEIMLDIERQFQEKLEKEKKRPHFNLFIAKIKEYNEAKEYYSHYVLLKDGNLMVISFIHNRWKFEVVELENE